MSAPRDGLRPGFAHGPRGVRPAELPGASPAGVAHSGTHRGEGQNLPQVPGKLGACVRLEEAPGRTNHFGQRATVGGDNRYVSNELWVRILLMLSWLGVGTISATG
jgi:hypothetical protein